MRVIIVNYGGTGLNVCDRACVGVGVGVGLGALACESYSVRCHLFLSPTRLKAGSICLKMDSAASLLISVPGWSRLQS